MKKVRIILSSEAEEVYKYLITESNKSKQEKAILNSFEKKKELIKLNHHYGEPISKNKIPDKFKEEYDVTNLF